MHIKILQRWTFFTAWPTFRNRSGEVEQKQPINFLRFGIINQPSPSAFLVPLQPTLYNMQKESDPSIRMFIM